MTKLSKPVTRETAATIFERSKSRPILVTLEPPALIGFKLKGTRRTFYLDAGQCYALAVKKSLAAEANEKRKARKESKR